MNSKTKVIEHYLDYCKRNSITITQAELQQLCTVPYTHLKRILAQKMQTA